MLQVLERMQRKIEEVARSARRIQHGEVPQPFQESPQRPIHQPPLTRSRPRRPRRDRAFETGGDLGACPLPLGEPRTDDHRLDDAHDLVPVGVVRAELRPLVRVESALEQRAEDRGVDLRPVEVRRIEGRLNLGPRERQRRVVLEQSAVEPVDGLEPHPAAGRHRAEKVPCQRREFVGPLPRLLQHAGEHVIREKPNILGEHAEDQAVDEMRHVLRVVSPLAQGLRQRCERGGRALGQRLPALARTQPLGVGHRPLELVANGRVGEIVQRELVCLADAVGPVGANAEPRHVGDD